MGATGDSVSHLGRRKHGSERGTERATVQRGLFKDAGSHEFLGTHRVSDRHLAPALDELSRQEVEGGERRFVDYGFVGVRELGSVYEGLLEFSLRIADEDLVVVKEKGLEALGCVDATDLVYATGIRGPVVRLGDAASHPYVTLMLLGWVVDPGKSLEEEGAPLKHEAFGRPIFVYAFWPEGSTRYLVRLDDLR